MIIAFVRFIPKPSSLASSVLAIANTLILTLRLSEPFNINNPKFNPNPNRLEVHYKVTSDILSQDQIESSCFVFLSRRGDYIDGEVDECVWEGIFPQNVPGYLRIGDMFDKSMGQDMVVARFSIYDPIHP